MYSTPKADQRQEPERHALDRRESAAYPKETRSARKFRSKIFHPKYLEIKPS
jgi:hypothetical protein